MSRSSPRILIALAFVLVAAGCSSTKVVSRWETHSTFQRTSTES